jgi:hypothetical protein
VSTIVERRESADQPKNHQRRRGWLFSIKRSLLGLAILLLALPVLGFSYETIAAAVDAQRFPPHRRVNALQESFSFVCAGRQSCPAQTKMRYFGRDAQRAPGLSRTLTA